MTAEDPNSTTIPEDQRWAAHTGETALRCESRGRAIEMSSHFASLFAVRLVTADEWDAITAALEAARLAVGASGGIDWLAFVERLTALRTALNALDGKS